MGSPFVLSPTGQYKRGKKHSTPFVLYQAEFPPLTAIICLGYRAPSSMDWSQWQYRQFPVWRKSCFMQTTCFCYWVTPKLLWVSYVISNISEFWQFSGLTVNWPKSVLLPLDQGVNSLSASLCPVPVVISFKYLGIVISPQPIDYYCLKWM